MFPQDHYRGRGNRGRGGNNKGGRHLVSQMGSYKLFKESLSSQEMEKEFQEFLKNKKGIDNKAGESSTGSTGSKTSYAKMISDKAENDESDSLPYIKMKRRDMIMVIESKDLIISQDPYQIQERYLETRSFPGGAIKGRLYYESILIKQGMEIKHFFPLGNESYYNFSKAVIKEVLTAEKWGLSPFREKEFFSPELKQVIKYNYWDYKEAFQKCFFYENHKKKHTWWFKTCPLLFKTELPNWFYDWWAIFGPSENILPKPFLDLFIEWSKTNIPTVTFQFETLDTMRFFLEFSIPWIWRWEPEMGYNNIHLPCLRRVYFTSFWRKMIQIDPTTGQIFGQETLDHITKKIKEDQIRQKEADIKKAAFPSFVADMKLKGVNTKQEIINTYLTKMKEDIKIHFNMDIEEEEFLSDTSSKNEVCDSQDPYDMGTPMGISEIEEQLRRQD